MVTLELPPGAAIWLANVVTYMDRQELTEDEDHRLVVLATLAAHGVFCSSGNRKRKQRTAIAPIKVPTNLHVKRRR